MQRKLPCRFWLQGKCTFGDKCKNSHDTPSAIGSDASGSATATATVPIPTTQQRAGTCPFFSKGTCMFGDQCRLSHRLATETQSKQYGGHLVEISKLMVLDHVCSTSTLRCAKAVRPVQILHAGKMQQGGLSFRPHPFELVHFNFREHLSWSCAGRCSAYSLQKHCYSQYFWADGVSIHRNPMSHHPDNRHSNLRVDFFGRVNVLEHIVLIFTKRTVQEKKMGNRIPF